MNWPPSHPGVDASGPSPQAQATHPGLKAAAPEATGWIAPWVVAWARLRQRRQWLTLCAGFLLAPLLVLMLSWHMAGAPHIEAQWQSTEHGELRLHSSAHPLMQPFEGQVLQKITSVRRGTDSPNPPAEVAITHPALLADIPSSRWLFDARLREQWTTAQATLQHLLQQEQIKLVFEQGDVNLPLSRWSWHMLASRYPVLCGAALLLFLSALVHWTARPSRQNQLYVLMASGQAGQLLLLACNAEPFMRWQAVAPFQSVLSAGLDIITACAALHQALLRSGPDSPDAGRAHHIWSVALLVAAMGMVTPAPWDNWLWHLMPACLMAEVVRLTFMHLWRGHRDALALELTVASLGLFSWLGLCVLLNGMAQPDALMHRLIDSPNTVIVSWYVLMACSLAALPYLRAHRQFSRDFVLGASLYSLILVFDLAFVALFAWSTPLVLTLSLTLSLLLYLPLRHWLMARDAQVHLMDAEQHCSLMHQASSMAINEPQRTVTAAAWLLTAVFKPSRTEWVSCAHEAAIAKHDGSAMTVPFKAMLRDLSPQVDLAPRQPGQPAHNALRLVHAHKGQALFVSEHMVLADRLMAQFQRITTFERGFESGCMEERRRLANDLHDDIGARLSSLMLTSQDPVLQELLRETLQDMRALTQAMAGEHRSMKVSLAGWEKEIRQRLDRAGVSCEWHIHLADDPRLHISVWSALSRILKELTTNVLKHAQARHVNYVIHLDHQGLSIKVLDDGVGTSPSTWQHGTGTASVRTRVRRCGGEVRWLPRQGGGVQCQILIKPFVPMLKP